MFIELTLLFVAVFLLLCYHCRRPFTQPPGPRPLPVIGNIYELIGPTKLHLKLTKLAQRFGDIYSLTFPCQPLTIVISSAALAREALLAKKDAFSGRPKVFSMSVFSKDGKDIGFSDFDAAFVWKKKIAANALRMSMGNMERVVQNEIENLEVRLKTLSGVGLDYRQELGLATLNIGCALLTGQRYERSDPELLKILKLTNNFGNLSVNINVLDIFPWLYNFPLKTSKLLRETVALRDDIIGKIYSSHKSTFQENRIRDISDALIQARLDAEKENKAVSKLITDEHLAMTILDIFVGSQHTITTTLGWFVLYMMQHPRVQARAQREIDDVIGTNRWPVAADRQRLPYIESVIAETLRLCSLAPLMSAPHKAICDTTLRGYDIPKGTIVLFNQWAIHHDSKEWKNPDRFDPTRFIDDEGKFVAAGLSFLPFSAGRRHCLGEFLAKPELFLFVSRLLQQFTFREHPDMPLPDLEGSGGFVNHPKPFKFCVSKRAM